MGDCCRIRASSSDLPHELLQRIAKCFDTDTDVRRFRAVCNSWRSSASPLRKFPCTPLKLPFPFVAGDTSHPKHHGAYFNLTERIVYRVQLPECQEPPNFWLVKIESSGDGKLRVLNPVSDQQMKILPETQMPKVLNTLDFRVCEVYKAYTLRYVNPSKPKQSDEYKYVKKVVVSTCLENDKYVVMAIDDAKRLWYLKSGDEKWSLVTDSNRFVDVVNYNGQFIAIDTCGGAWEFDSLLKASKFTHYRYEPSSKRHLVDLHKGELFLVEEVSDNDKRVCECYDIDNGCQCRFPRTPVRNTVEEVNICMLDKIEWVAAKSINDQIIFVGDDCSFSVPAEDVEGCRGTRVFYTDQYIFFQTEEQKPHYHYDRGYDYDYGIDYDDQFDYGYSYFECDCGNSSDDDTLRIDTFVPSEDVKLKFRGLHGHNTGVCDFESGKIGSLLKFPEYGDIFWPPPSWLSHN